MKLKELDILTIRRDALELVKELSINPEKDEQFFISECWTQAVCNELFRKGLLEEVTREKLDVDKQFNGEY